MDVTYTLDMNTYGIACGNALEYIDSKKGIAWDWASQVIDWKEEFDIDLYRSAYPKADKMTFKSKEDATAWLLRFS